MARVSPGARRSGACRSMVWLRFWSPSTTRVRSQLFGVVLEAYCRACTILLICMWHAFRLGLAGLARADRWFGFGFGHRAPRGYEASSLCLFLRSIVKHNPPFLYNTRLAWGSQAWRMPVDGLASVLVTEHHEGTKPALCVCS